MGLYHHSKANILYIYNCGQCRGQNLSSTRSQTVAALIRHYLHQPLYCKELCPSHSSSCDFAHDSSLSTTQYSN